MLNTMADDSINKSRSRVNIVLKTQSKADNKSFDGRRKYILPTLYDGQMNGGRNNYSMMVDHTYQSTNQTQIRQYSFLVEGHDTRKSWKRNQTKPIFAEENFPMARKILPPPNQQFQITLDLNNPKMSRNETEGTGGFNSQATFTIPPVILDSSVFGDRK